MYNDLVSYRIMFIEYLIVYYELFIDASIQYASKQSLIPSSSFSKTPSLALKSSTEYYSTGLNLLAFGPDAIYYFTGRIHLKVMFLLVYVILTQEYHLTCPRRQ